MRLCILLAVIAVFGAAGCLADDSQGGIFGGRLAGVVEPRLGANIIRITQLEKLIKRLKERIDEAHEADPEKFVDEIEARISTLEGDHCPEREFQCGDTDQECISDLFVCDGHDDCHNGHDEDEDICSTAPVKAGNIFTGMLHWKDCLIREDHLSHITITSTKRFKYFSSRVLVRAIATSVSEDAEGHQVTRKANVIGYYNFSNRKLVLRPVKSEQKGYHLGLRCVFNHGDDERADCELLTEASLHVCAEVHLSLEHHDEH
jgi:hypothetical protein